MYSNYKLENNPSFKMTKDTFNSLINSLTTEQEADSLPVKVGVTIRTTHTNLVACREESVVFLNEIRPEHKGYFSVLSSVVDMLNHTFKNLPPTTMAETVLMPVGAFIDNQELVIYLHLIIKDEHLEVFNSNASVTFLSIGENDLNNLKTQSIMVLPTLSIVK